MATRWEQKLRSFQRALEAFRAFAQVDLQYGVVHVHGPIPDPDETQQASIYASGGTLAESLLVPITDDDYQLHLLFGMDLAPVKAEIIKQFKSLLRDLHDIYPILPKWVPTPVRLPGIANGGDENLVRWGLTLLSVGATEQKVFRCENEYADSAISFQINGRVTPWENLSPVPGFNPIEFVTRRGKPPREWPFWKQEHARAGRAFPEVLAVSLTKPIFYASLNAVDLLIQIGLERRPESSTKRRPSLTTRDGTTLTDKDRLVIGALRQHHKEEGGETDFTPLSQTTVARMARISQPSVNRMYRDHLCKLEVCRGLTPQKCYVHLCRRNLIMVVLEQIENPLRREELTNIQNIERIKKEKGKPDDDDDYVDDDTDDTDDE